MTDKLQVKEHLRNSALYQPLSEPSLSEEWKRRLLYQHTSHEQIRAALRERPRLPKRFVCIGVPVLCMALVFAWYFGFIYPERWFENIIPLLSSFENIVPLLSLDVPHMGLKEALVLVAIVNGMTFIIRRRMFAL